MIIFFTNNYHYKVLGFQLLKKMTFRGCGHKIITSTRLPRWALRLQQAIINKLKYNFNHMYTKHELWTFTIIQFTQKCTQTIYIHNNKKWNKVNKSIWHEIVHIIFLIFLKKNVALAWFTPIWLLSCSIFHKIIILSGTHASFEKSWIDFHVCIATLLMNILLSLTIWNLG
jgi:hypothetical protein